MLEFGLTGGIGSGKSTVSAALAERGATIIDADAIVRELQQPGERMFDMMVERWGQKIVTAEGTLDRAAVAGIVFADDDELNALNGMVHPVVAEETERRRQAVIDAGDPSAVVVHDIPLLVVPGGELLTSRDVDEWAGIIVVDTPEEFAIERVMASRGMERDDIVARMDAQASREERRAAASFVIDNSGSLDDLEAEIDRCWEWMQSRTGGEHTEGGPPDSSAGPSRMRGESAEDGN